MQNKLKLSYFRGSDASSLCLVFFPLAGFQYSFFCSYTCSFFPFSGLHTYPLQCWASSTSLESHANNEFNRRFLLFSTSLQILLTCMLLCISENEGYRIRAQTACVWCKHILNTVQRALQIRKNFCVELWEIFVYEIMRFPCVRLRS